MALVTFTGYPCSGKSRRVSQLVRELENRGSLPVVVVSDDNLNISKAVYNDSKSEKPARAALLTAVQRQLSPNAIVIVDAPNYIKGFRYQLYCAARELKLRVCTVHVLATQDLCREWNAAREDAYTPETLENLFLRYEEPSSMVRWDSPLFTVPWTDDQLPIDDIVRAVTSGLVKPPNSGTLNATKPPTDALLTLESVSLAIVSAIVSSSSQAGSVTLPVSESLSVNITLPPRSLTLPELQRLKRQFVTIHKKAITLGSTERGDVDWSEQKVADKFVDYLQENLNR